MSSLKLSRLRLSILVASAVTLLVVWYRPSLGHSQLQSPSDLSSLGHLASSSFPNLPLEGSELPFDDQAEADYVSAPDALHSFFQDVDHGDWRQINYRTIRDLHGCLAVGNCGKHQAQVVIFTGDWVMDTVLNGGGGGEAVWILSMMKALRQMGYTYLIAPDYVETLALYRMLPELVRILVGFSNEECTDDWMCVKSDHNPTGIPRWKSDHRFDMAFFPWGGNSGDIGWEWVLHAERPGPSDPLHEGMHYIGYSLEDQCNAKFDGLVEGNSAWVYAKQLTYAYTGFPEFGWNRSYFSLATADLAEYDFSFRASYIIDETFLADRIEEGPMRSLEAVINLDNLDTDEFAREIAQSRILVGLGQPWLAPSAYLALCLGTPFLNVLKRWDPEYPNDRRLWDSQHNALMGMDPPYVYNVRAGDYDGFLAALKGAIEHPITTPYIDPEMTELAMRQRVSHLVERDWRALADERWVHARSQDRQPSWTL